MGKKKTMLQFTTWYAILCVIATINMVALVVVWRRTTNPSTPYQKWMRLLALPWVFECSYRSIFPSLYLQRFVVWDTLFNSILLDRTLAFAGELAWTAQFSLVVLHLDQQLTPTKTWWVQGCAVLVFVIYFCAECMAFYNTATTNEVSDGSLLSCW